MARYCKRPHENMNIDIDWPENELLRAKVDSLTSQVHILKKAQEEKEWQYVQTIEQLNHQIASSANNKERALKEKEDENRKLQSEVERLKTQACNLQQAHETKEKQYMHTIHQLEHQLAISSPNKTKENDIKRLQMEVERLTTQLSHGMNQRLAENETAVENVNKTNRPTRIVDEYMELMSNQWLGAKDRLDEVYSEDSQEEFKLKLLCDVLLEAESLAHQEMKAYKMFIQQSLQDPITALSLLRPEGYTDNPASTDDEKCRSLTLVAESELSGTMYPQIRPKLEGDFEDFDEQVLGGDLKNLLSAFVKDKSNKLTSHRLAQVLIHKLQTKEGHWKEILSSNGCEQSLMDYIQGACVVCWKMAAQRPPMTFDFGGIGCPPSKDKHEFYYNCSKAKDAVISSYVSPALMHQEKLLVKGKVFTQAKEMSHLITKYG